MSVFYRVRNAQGRAGLAILAEAYNMASIPAMRSLSPYEEIHEFGAVAALFSRAFFSVCEAA